MIDWTEFNQYLQSYGQELILKLIDMFIRDYPATIVSLRKSVAERDYPGIDIISHDLKSNSALFGGVESANIAFTLETMGKEFNDDGIEAVLAEVELKSAQLREELIEYRKTVSG